MLWVGSWLDFQLKVSALDDLGRRLNILEIAPVREVCTVSESCIQLYISYILQIQSHL